MGGSASAVICYHHCTKINYFPLFILIWNRDWILDWQFFIRIVPLVTLFNIKFQGIISLMPFTMTDNTHFLTYIFIAYISNISMINLLWSNIVAFFSKTEKKWYPGSRVYLFFCVHHKCMVPRWFKITTNSNIRGTGFFFNTKTQARYIWSALMKQEIIWLKK